MTRDTSHSRTKLNQRLLDIPVGAVLTLAWLRAQGISPKLANYYATSGWLHRIGDGAFTLKSEAPSWLGAVFGLQQKGGSLHPGGQTALELTGLAHFLPLGDNYPVYLFGQPGERLPEWFKRLPWVDRVRHVCTSFLPPELGLREHKDGGFVVRVSDPERAILEFLLHLTISEAGYEQANLVFEGLGTLRSALLQSLLEQCASIKVKRLFLHLAQRNDHPWFHQLDPAKISLGSGKRVLFPGGRLDPKYLITVPKFAEAPADAP